MSIRRLRVQGIRNLQDVDLELASVNVFFGANGSGKTSLLEAVYVLGSGKSFRAPRLDPVITTSPQSASCMPPLLIPTAVPSRWGLHVSETGSFKGGSRAERCRTRPNSPAAYPCS